MINPDSSEEEVVFIPEEGVVVEWPTFGMTALSLMSSRTDRGTGATIYPTDYERALARALLTGNWGPLRQFHDLTLEEEVGASAETIKWYDLNARQYTERIRQVLSVDQLRDFLLGIPVGGIILDAGCGGGRDSNYFFQHGFIPVGIDLSRGMISESKKTFPLIHFLQMDFRSLHFADEIFDGVWTHGSIHHLGTMEDVVASLHEFYRVLKTGGTIHIATQAKTKSKDTIIVTDELSNHNRFYRYFTLSQLQDLLKFIGFRVVSITQHKETEDEVSTGRKNVEWIVALAIKD